MKNVKKNAIILLLITFFVLYYILKDEFSIIVETLKKADIRWILVSVLFVFLYWTFKTLALRMIVKEYRKDITFIEMLKQIFIVQFFNGITPFSSGGQPMQVYMLKKSGIKLTHSTNIIIQDFVLYQMALITCGIIAVGLNFHYNFLANNEFLRGLTVIGFTINTFIGIGLLFISFSTKFNNFIIKNIIKLLSKFNFIKNKTATIKSWEEKINEFHESAIILRKNKGLVIKGYLYNVLGLIAFYMTPLFIIYSFNLNIDVIATYVSGAYVAIIGSFIPIPGGSGGTEYSFMEFFSNFIPVKGTVSAVLLVWRSITYYLGIIIGALALNTFKGVEEICE